MSETPIIDELIEDMELQGVEVGVIADLCNLPKCPITNSYQNEKRIIEVLWSRRLANG